MLIFFKLAVWNDDRAVSDRTHTRYYDLRRVLDYFQRCTGRL
jgi:lipocalin-like protein